MKRTQIQLDEVTHQLLKDRAYSENRSMASLIRDAVAEYVAEPAVRKTSVREFRFIGAGASPPDENGTVSTNHDSIFSEAIQH